MEEIKEELEIWKSLDFLDYPDYEVSNYGQVKSLERVVIFKDGRKRTYSEKILKPWKDNKGYLRVEITNNKKQKTFAVHRLVCLTFLENPNNLPQVNHRNEIKSDNRVENLEWCNNLYNCNYGKHKERLSESLKGKPKSEEFKKKMRKPILQFTKDMVFIREWNSAITTSKELGIDSSGIGKCCRGEQKTAGGFLWKYKEI